MAHNLHAVTCLVQHYPVNSTYNKVRGAPGKKCSTNYDQSAFSSNLLAMCFSVFCCKCFLTWMKFNRKCSYEKRKIENVDFFFNISIFSHYKLVWRQFNVRFEVAFFYLKGPPLAPAVWNVPICLCVYVCILSTAAADQLRAGGPWHQCGWREARYWSPAGPRSWTTGRFPIFRSSFSFSPSSYLLSPSVCKASCATVFRVLGGVWDIFQYEFTTFSVIVQILKTWNLPFWWPLEFLERKWGIMFAK